MGETRTCKGEIMANWSKKLPTKEGYYWLRKKGNSRATIVYLTKKDPEDEWGLAVWFFGNEQEEYTNSPGFVDSLWKRVK